MGRSVSIWVRVCALVALTVPGCSDESGGTGGGGGGTGGTQPQALTHLYFLDWGGGVLSTTLDGDELRDFAGDDSQGADGVAVDLAAGKMYYTGNFTGAVGTANLDGSDPTEVIRRSGWILTGIVLGPGP